MEIKRETKRNIIFIELLRIIACFCVIINHTSSDVFLTRKPGVVWFAAVTWFFFSKIAVPVFLMIYGYLVLDRQTDYKKTMGRLIRFGAILIICSFIYYCINYHGKKSVSEFLYVLYCEGATNAFWYLYLYLALILLTPLLQRLVSGFRQKDFLYTFLIFECFCVCVPVVTHYMPWIQLNYWFIEEFHGTDLIYVLIGCCFKRYPPERKNLRNVRIFSTLVFFGALLMNVLFTHYEFGRNNGQDYLFFDNRIGFFVILQSAAIFRLFSTFHLKETKASSLLLYFGSLTFGIYLMSDLLINQFSGFFESMTASGIHVLPALLIYELSVFAVGALFTAILKTIPFFKKYI